MAKVVSLNTSKTKGVFKIPAQEVTFIEDFGIEK